LPVAGLFKDLPVAVIKARQAAPVRPRSTRLQ